MKINTMLLIVLNSFLILFLELALIRFLPTRILYLGFFTNFVLLASFFGIGIGFLLGRIKSSLLYVFPFTLLILVTITHFFTPSVNVETSDVLFFKGSLDPSLTIIPTYLLLPFLFCVISIVFATLSQPLAKLFIQSKNPIAAYTFDIIGALIGIVGFYLISYFAIPAFAWFAIFSIFFILLLLSITKKGLFLLVAALVLSFCVLLILDSINKRTIWSPYYKLDLLQIGSKNNWHLFANNSNHQYFSERKDASLHNLIFYELTSQEIPQNVLIIGSGTGQDISSALGYEIKQIDAVEIDPQILKIGEELHPEKPYDDSRVNAIIDDGRNFLRNTNKTYDLIIFALTDSLVLSSGKGNIRLESYLFTLESMQEVHKRLRKGGSFAMYNDYRQQWLIDRLSSMMKSVFQAEPKEIFIGPTARLIVVKKTDMSSDAIQPSTILPTDNWPFLYLKNKSIPNLYFIPLLIIFFIATVTTAFIIVKTTQKTYVNPTRLAQFFFLGAAFSLLEAKSIVQLNLLFGATWVVNALAFGGILLTVLIACLTTYRYKLHYQLLFVVLLFASLLLHFIPLNALLIDNSFARVILAIPFFYLPIFFANLFFATLFIKSKFPDLDFGSNMIGLLFGAIFEYIALATGYWALMLFIIFFYLLAVFFSLGIKHKSI